MCSIIYHFLKNLVVVIPVASTLYFSNWTLSFGLFPESFVHKYPPVVLDPQCYLRFSWSFFLSHENCKKVTTSISSSLPPHLLHWNLAPLKLSPGSAIRSSEGTLPCYALYTRHMCCNLCKPVCPATGIHNAHTPRFPTSLVTLYLPRVCLPCRVSLCLFPDHTSPVSFTLHS